MRLSDLSIFLLLALAPALPAQNIPTTEGGSGLKSNYLFPIWPGQRNALAGTMGELRNTHFHSGLDIRTKNQIGAPVLAIEQGYVSRAVKSPYSYGNVLYITHPDGNTSLYAHLDQFKGRIAEAVRAEQYRRKESNVDLNFKPGELSVLRGDTIALSGNTGSSQGPHLHFDIRDTEMNALNPLSYGFTEIKDTRPPVVRRVALRTMDKNARINGRFGRFTFAVVGTKGSYRLTAPVKATGLIGLEILADDIMDSAAFRYGINEFRVTANSETVFVQHINKIEMDNTRGILSVMDNEELEKTGHRYYRMYVADGNPLDMYSEVRNQGFIIVRSNQNILVSMKDSYRNESTLRLELHATPSVKKIPHPPGKPQLPGFEVDGHWLRAALPLCSKSATLFFRERNTNVEYDYEDGHHATYLIDLRQDIPDSISACGKTLRFHIRERIPSHVPFTFYGEGFKVRFEERSLFDTLYLEFHHRQEEGRPSLILADRTIPLLQPITVEWKPAKKTGPKSGVYRLDRGSYTLMSATWVNGVATFSTNRLGQFVVLDDPIPPRITLLSTSQQAARFRIRDDRSGIEKYEAYINGDWVALNYDYKTGILFTEKKSSDTPLRGELIVRVTDYCGNTSQFKRIIP